MIFAHVSSLSAEDIAREDANLFCRLLLFLGIVVIDTDDVNDEDELEDALIARGGYSSSRREIKRRKNPFASSRFIAKTFFAFALRTLTRNAKRRRKRRRRRRKTNARDGYFLGFVLDRGCRGSFQSLSSGHDDVKFGRRRIGRVMFTTREFLFICAFVVFAKRQICEEFEM